MNIKRRIQTALIMRRANRKIRIAAEEREVMTWLNRPHVQSVHMIGCWIPPKAPTARDYGITRSYVVGLLILFAAVVYFNTAAEVEAPLSCVVASK